LCVTNAGLRAFCHRRGVHAVMVLRPYFINYFAAWCPYVVLVVSIFVTVQVQRANYYYYY